MAQDSGISEEPAFLKRVYEECDDFIKFVDDKLKREKQQREANKKKTELETKLAQERKLNKDLSARVAELKRRRSELDKACAAPLAVAESDQKRLDNVKEMYQIGKELTGIRFDFSAPPNVAKGYIKCESRKALQPFEVSEGDSEALWSILQAAQGSAPPADKENHPHN